MLENDSDTSLSYGVSGRSSLPGASSLFGASLLGSSKPPLSPLSPPGNSSLPPLSPLSPPGSSLLPPLSPAGALPGSFTGSLLLSPSLHPNNNPNDKIADIKVNRYFFLIIFILLSVTTLVYTLYF